MPRAEMTMVAAELEEGPEARWWERCGVGNEARADVARRRNGSSDWVLAVDECPAAGAMPPSP